MTIDDFRICATQEFRYAYLDAIRRLPDLHVRDIGDEEASDLPRTDECLPLPPIPLADLERGEIHGWLHEVRSLGNTLAPHLVVMAIRLMPDEFFADGEGPSRQESDRWSSQKLFRRYGEWTPFFEVEAQGEDGETVVVSAGFRAIGLALDDCLRPSLRLVHAGG